MLFVTLTSNVSSLHRRSFANKAILRHYPLANQRFLRSVADYDKTQLEPAIWSRDTGQWIPCFDRCQLTITLMYAVN